MTKHGFARDMEFKLVSHEAAEVWFLLDADEETVLCCAKPSMVYRFADAAQTQTRA